MVCAIAREVERVGQAGRAWDDSSRKMIQVENQPVVRCWSAFEDQAMFNLTEMALERQNIDRPGEVGTQALSI